jgi:hypothetical protein
VRHGARLPCFEIRPGNGEEFDRRHAEAWPDFLAALGDAGFRMPVAGIDGEGVPDRVEEAWHFKGQA